MPAKDIYHEAFVRALLKDGWIITHDPLSITVGETNLQIDIGAEPVVVAERNNERIAVEIKSFVSLSAVQDLKEAVGQFMLYELALKQSISEPDRVLFLAVREAVYNSLFVEGIGSLFLANRVVRLVVFDPDTEDIIAWIQ